MTGLVKRLRNLGDKISAEAAAEIEKLMAANDALEAKLTDALTGATAAAISTEVARGVFNDELAAAMATLASIRRASAAT